MIKLQNIPHLNTHTFEQIKPMSTSVCIEVDSMLFHMKGFLCILKAGRYATTSLGRFLEDKND